MSQTTFAPELRVSDFDYVLPPELIAQSPPQERDASRLLVLDRETGALHHSSMRELSSWLRAGDLLVANNSRVLAARLRGVKADTGGHVELLLLRKRDDGLWQAMAKPARRLRPGTRLVISANDGTAAPPAEAEVAGVGEEGEVVVALPEAVEANLDAYGVTPLPPYIHAALDDPERYQTTYAKVPGSAAAPTAGLHFTPELRHSLTDAGIAWTEVTLHIGLDTFRPVRVDRVADHKIHREWCEVSAETIADIVETQNRGGRVLAVGTTAARTLETLGAERGLSRDNGYRGMTSLFIVPGHEWRVVDMLLTNFHLPRSTLLMMVSAFASTDQIRRAYDEAIADRYRFYSFGDAMLIR